MKTGLFLRLLDVSGSALSRWARQAGKDPGVPEGKDGRPGTVVRKGTDDRPERTEMDGDLESGMVSRSPGPERRGD